MNYFRQAQILSGLIVLSLFDFTAGHRTIVRSTLRVYSPEYHHGLAGNQDTLDYWGNSRTSVCTNSLGLRVSCTEDLKDDNVWVIGDSFTEGVGVNYDRTFVGIVGVTNLGVCSYSPKLYYYKVKSLLEQSRRPKQLVVFIDTSDAMDELIYQRFVPGVNPGVRFWLFKNSWVSHKIMSSPAGDIQEPIQLKRTWWEYSRWLQSRDGSKGLWMGSYWITELQRLCRDEGIKLTLAVYPWPGEKHTSLYYQHWHRFATMQEIPMIDLFPILEQRKDIYFQGDVHWNEAGHKQVAPILLQFLVARTNLPG